MDLQDEKMTLVRDWIEKSSNIVFFGGAGVSTASKIPDFRSADGIYQQESRYRYPPETILSSSFFDRHPDVFYDYLFDKMWFPDAKPNAAHTALAALEKVGKLRGVITQNIDGLHQKAGSQRVVELHGNMRRFYCMDCLFPAGTNAIDPQKGVPHCTRCDGVLRPDVVLYEETLDREVLDEAVALISGAGILLVGGTSLVVYPAAGLIRYYKGQKLVLINREPTPMDHLANLVVYGDIAEVLPRIVAGV